MLSISTALLVRSGALAALAAPLFAGTITISPGNGTLHAAVAAAAPGDTIVVMQGIYAEPGTLVVDKPLTILGVGSPGPTFVAYGATLFDGVLPLLIDGLAAGEEVRVAGLTLRSGNPFTLDSEAPSVVVSNCAGPVVLAGLNGASAAGQPGAPAILGVVQVHASDQVTITDCSFFAKQGTAGSVAPEAVTTLFVEDSTVTLNLSALHGGEGTGSIGTGLGGDGAPAIRAKNSTLRIDSSYVAGGAGDSGAGAGGTLGLAGNGAVALHAEGSIVRVRGNEASVMVGGDGSLGTAIGAGAPAAFLDAGSQLVTTVDATVEAGADGDGLLTAPTLDPAGGGAWTQLAERLAVSRYGPAVTKLGYQSWTEIYGEPNSIAVGGFSAGQATALELPSIVGPIALDLAGLGTLPAVALDATGFFHSIQLSPTTPALAGVHVLLQTVVLSPSGTVSVSAPSLRAFVE